jgi:hypothetical protein
MIKRGKRVTLIDEKYLSCIFCHTNVNWNYLKQGNALWALTADVTVRKRYIVRVHGENQERLKANVVQLVLMRDTMRNSSK